MYNVGVYPAWYIGLCQPCYVTHLGKLRGKRATTGSKTVKEEQACPALQQPPDVVLQAHVSACHKLHQGKHTLLHTEGVKRQDSTAAFNLGVDALGLLAGRLQHTLQLGQLVACTNRQQ